MLDISAVEGSRGRSSNLKCRTRLRFAESHALSYVPDVASSEIDPGSVPLLFPDPVIEFYLSKVDRTAIREQSKKMLEERLRCLEEEAKREQLGSDALVQEESLPWPAKKGKIDVGIDPAWFAEAKAVPLLVPDPVTEAYLEDVDRGLLRENLNLSVEERLDQFAAFMNAVYEFRGAALADKKGLWDDHSLIDARESS